MGVKIVQVSKILPEFERTTPEIIPYVERWLMHQDDRFIRKVVKLFEGAQVDRRFSMLDPEIVFSELSFEKRNNLYKAAAIRESAEALEKALVSAHWTPESLDFIITVSCTGIMIPSVDAYLINHLELKQDIVRLPVTEMGCVGGVSGLIYAKNFLKANPGKRAAVIAVESPTTTLQLTDFSMANMVSAAIFGDGTACVLLSSEVDAQGPKIIDEGMYHFFDHTKLMGFDWVETGLQMVLSPEVPDVIEEHMQHVLGDFLDRNGLHLGNIEHFIFHPGGKRIVQQVEQSLLPFGKNINATKAVLREYGNMSSATVLYVLEEILSKPTKTGDLGVMLSFGPGFTAQRILLEW
jgi:alkylresorcinol/alkylpyrone synthase